jgi:hypothetical protein
MAEIERDILPSVAPSTTDDTGSSGTAGTASSGKPATLVRSGLGLCTLCVLWTLCTLAVSHRSTLCLLLLLRPSELVGAVSCRFGMSVATGSGGKDSRLPSRGDAGREIAILLLLLTLPGRECTRAGEGVDTSLALPCEVRAWSSSRSRIGTTPIEAA